MHKGHHFASPRYRLELISISQSYLVTMPFLLLIKPARPQPGSTHSAILE
jgi:hypothetical protein